MESTTAFIQILGSREHMFININAVSKIVGPFIGAEQQFNLHVGQEIYAVKWNENPAAYGQIKRFLGLH